MAGPDCDIFNRECWTCSESPVVGWEAGDSLGHPVKPTFNYNPGATLGKELWTETARLGFPQVPVSVPPPSHNFDDRALENIDAQNVEDRILAAAAAGRASPDRVIYRWRSLIGGATVPRPQGTDRPIDPQGHVQAEGELDPVDVLTGEFYVEHVDLALPSFGVAFEHRRTYRSRVDYDGPLGPGWDFSYNQRLFAAPPVVDAGEPPPPEIGPHGLPLADVPPAEVDDDEDGPACGPVLILTMGNGTTLRFRELAVAGTVISYSSAATDLTLTGHIDGDLTRWQLATNAGDVRRFDERGLLVGWVDANDVGLTFAWEAGIARDWRLARVHDGVGRTIDYSYDGGDRLTRVADAASGLFARYEYDAQHGGLWYALRADGKSERYEYDVAPGRTHGDWVPERVLEPLCAMACAVSSSSCDAGGACDAAVAEATGACLDSCPACAEECTTECRGQCGAACRSGAGGCADACTATCDMQPHREAMAENCEELFDTSGAAGVCATCRDSCRELSSDQCHSLFTCVDVATDGTTVVVGTGPQCVSWASVGDGFEDLGRGLFLLVSGGIGWLACQVIEFFGGECSMDWWHRNKEQLCDDDVVNCCIEGDDCSASSCNANMSCEDSCRAMFVGLGGAGNCPAPVNAGSPCLLQYPNGAPHPIDPEYGDYVACVGTASTWSLHNGCFSASEDLCKEDCSETCTSQCATPCVASCGEVCNDGCHVDECPAFCTSLDLAGACGDACTADCVADNHARGPVAGPKYGYTADLQYNLVKIFDGNGELYLENTYESEITKPSFDTVIAQRYGEHTGEMHHVDLAYDDPLSGWAAGLVESLADYDAPEICHYGCEATVPDPRDVAVPWNDVILVFDGGSGAETPSVGWSVSSTFGGATDLAPTHVIVDSATHGRIARRAVQSPLSGNSVQLDLSMRSGSMSVMISDTGEAVLEGDEAAAAELVAAGGFTIFGDGFQVRAYPGHPTAVVAVAEGGCGQPFHMTRTGADEVKIEPADACSDRLWLAPIASAARGLDPVAFFEGGQDAIASSYYVPSMLAPTREPMTFMQREKGSYARARAPSDEAQIVAVDQSYTLYTNVALFSVPLPEDMMVPDAREIVYVYHQDTGGDGAAYPPERPPTDVRWSAGDTPDTVYQPPCSPDQPVDTMWGTGIAGAGTKPARATAVLDLHGARWIYYADEHGRLIRTVNRETGASRWMEYDPAGRVTGMLAPDGARQCLRYDDHGNVEEVLTLAAPQPGAPTPPPIRQRFGWTPAPARLQVVYDPRDLSRVLQQRQYDSRGNLRALIEIDGARTDIELVGGVGPARAMPRAVIGPDGSRSVVEYDVTNGTVRTVVEDDGGPSPVVSEVQSDPAGRPLLKTSPLGLIEELEWDGPLLESRTWDADGLERIEHYTHDDDAQLLTVTRDRSTVSFEYDATGAITASTHAAVDGSLPSATRCRRAAPDGRVIEEVSAEGSRVRYTHDGEGRIKSVVAGNLGPSLGAWDDDCRASASGQHAAGTIGTYDYDTSGRVIATTDGRGTRTTWRYDGHGRPIVEARADGGETRTGYDHVGQVRWQAAYSVPAGPVISEPQWGQPGLLAATFIAYDLRGRVNEVRRWHFDSQGIPIGDGVARTAYEYDEAARTITVTDDLGRSTRTRMDGAGRTVEVRLPDGSAVTTEYSDGGRSVRTTRTGIGGPVVEATTLTAAGYVAESAIDAAGTHRVLQTVAWADPFLPSSTTSATGEVATISYDAFERVRGRITTIPGGHGEELALALDGDGRVTTRTSVAMPGAPPATWKFEHDALGRTWRQVDPAGGETITAYVGATALPLTVVDPRQIQTTFTYSFTGAVQHARVNGPGVTDINLGYLHDRLGRVVTAYRQDGVDPEVHNELRWDSLGNLISETDTVIGPAANRTHVFDGAGQRIRSALGAHAVDRTFDNLGRQRTLAVNGSVPAVATWSYGAPGGPVARLLDNGVESKYGYDKLSRLVAIGDWLGNARLAQHTWALPLDGVPRHLSVRNAALPDLDRAFAIDPAGRVTAEQADIGATVHVDTFDASSAPTAAALAAMDSDRTSYGLDGRHNWLTRSVGGALTTFARDDRDALTAMNNTPVWTDEGGAVVHDGTTAYAYDALGLLSEVHRNDDAGRSYRRDAFGRVVAETDTATGVTTRYAWDGNQRVVAADAAGALTTTFAAEGLDAPVMTLAPGGNRTYYHQDRQGSVYAQTNADGAPKLWLSYSAYGETTLHDASGEPVSPLAAHNSFGYHGLPHDFALGLVDMRARAYVPSLGRFLSPDPIALAGGSNLFAFVDSSPLAWRDPFGLAKQAALDYSRRLEGLENDVYDVFGITNDMLRPGEPSLLGEAWMGAGEFATSEMAPRAFGVARMYVAYQIMTASVAFAAATEGTGGFVAVGGMVLAMDQGYTAAGEIWYGEPGTSLSVRTGAVLVGRDRAAEAEAFGLGMCGSLAPPPRGWSGPALRSPGSLPPGTSPGATWIAADGLAVYGLPGRGGVTVPRRLTPSEMESLTVAHGKEFALLYHHGPGPHGAGGTYTLHSGTASSVGFPYNARSMLIWHTHPQGSPFASPSDRYLLEQLRKLGSPQRSSQIIPVGSGRAPARFDEHGTNR